MRVAFAPLLLLGLTLALACAEQTPDDPALRAACDDLCAAQITCEDTMLTMTACTNACVADVGTPGDDCHEALQVLAICAADHCGDAAACATQLGERDRHCGGAG